MKSIKAFELTLLAIFLAVGVTPVGASWGSPTIQEFKTAVAKLPKPVYPPPKAYLTIKHQGLDLYPIDKSWWSGSARRAYSKPFTLNMGPWYYGDHRIWPNFLFGWQIGAHLYVRKMEKAECWPALQYSHCPQ